MEMNFESEIIKPKESWSNIGGCFFKHPADKEKRAECENNVLAKRGGADLEIAKALGNKANKPSSSWSATQTAIVIGTSLIGLTVMIFVIKKLSNRNKAKA